MYRRWRIPIALLFASLPSLAQADIVRITSINGNYDANHASVVEVRPGDIVSLSADLFRDAYGEYAPQNRPVEEFIWTADDRWDDECDAARGDDGCLGNTQFDVTDWGVNFYVPYTIGREIRVTVRHRSGYATDTVLLQNGAYADNYVPPSRVITDPSEYSYDRLDPDYALTGHGRWVVIGGTRYWSPYRYRSDWVPYQNGYWTWTDDGYTWVSHDPWGWFTDHYGVWRSHGTYGWIWLPFPERRYRPHTVTWFHGDGYIGWYPYYDGYRDGYRHGYNEGFVDGYWDGYTAGRYYGTPGYHHYNPGFTFIRHTSFLSLNIFDIRVDISIGWSWWRTSYERSYYGAYPGGHDLWSSRIWVERGCGGTIPVTTVIARNVGGYDFRYPRRVHAVPDYYRGLPAYRSDYAGGGYHRPIPVGSVHGPGRGGAPVVTPPTGNGRGITQPPRHYDPGSGEYRPLPPRTGRPAQPHPGNPVYRPAPTPPHGPAPVPPYRPGPAPVPTYRPAPVPAPHPAPHPRPQPPVPGPAPTYVPRPNPPGPGPAPRPQPPVPGPAPTYVPRPNPPGPGPAPVPPRPQPPHPAPAPTYVPRPQPPGPGPRPPVPAPAPTYVPRPQPPGPGPAPRPAPTYVPRPQPPMPAPGPGRPGGPGPGPGHPRGPRPR